MENRRQHACDWYEEEVGDVRHWVVIGVRSGRCVPLSRLFDRAAVGYVVALRDSWFRN